MDERIGDMFTGYECQRLQELIQKNFSMSLEGVFKATPKEMLKNLKQMRKYAKQNVDEAITEYLKRLNDLEPFIERLSK